MKLFARSIYLLVLLYMHVTCLFGQIEHGGSPMMNNKDFHPEKVLYLLEPEDPEYVEGLKSTQFSSYKKALEFATERAVDLSPEQNGEWTEVDGIAVWRAHIISPEALSVGVFFSEFELEENARLFIYTPNGSVVKGAFTSENNKEYGSFAVGHLPGEEVIVELQVDDPGQEYGRIRIGSISHAFLPVPGIEGVQVTGLGTSQACEIDVNCTEGDDWQTLKRSVCHIYTGTLYCTGALINNTMYDGVPYILTAEHCINSNSVSNRSVFYFNYENSKCDTLDGKKTNSISGSTLYSTGDSLDFSLVKLSSRPPLAYNVYYAGWDARKQNHADVTTIHHPNADAKKISRDYDELTTPTVVPGNLNDYIEESNFRVYEWDEGSTEGGSSGGPLFSSGNKIIGSLSGGDAFCGDSIGYDAVNDRVIFSLSDNRNDYFSKLYYNWDHYYAYNKQLKRWLDPEGSGQLVLGGMDPGTLDAETRELPEIELLLFPNPATDRVYIQMEEYTGNDLAVEILDMTGRCMSENKIPADFPAEISVAGLPPGLYLVRVRMVDGMIAGRLLINQ